MPSRIPLPLSPPEHEALAERLVSEPCPPTAALDRDQRNLRQLRNSVVARLDAISFEASVIYGERCEVMLSSDETDLVLDAIGSPREEPPSVRPAARRACELREELHSRVGTLRLLLLGASGHRDACRAVCA